MGNNNNTFMDTMNALNNIAKNNGFTNVKDWAKAAHKAGELSNAQETKVEQLSQLRNMMAHGNARNISVADSELSAAKQFIGKMNSTKVSNTQKKVSTKDVKLPEDGIFRAAPFYKNLTFNRKDATYDFSFKITWEENRIDTGNGGIIANGFFIHILSAPLLDFAIDYPHEFHIINYNRSDPHICWSAPITSFKEANAVMLEWHKRYVKTLEKFGNIEARPRKNVVLPLGSFRASNNIPDTIFITESVLNKIRKTIGRNAPELGGMLGSSYDQTIIDYYVFDARANVNEVEYSPNTKFLNGVLNNDWGNKGVNLSGFIHSHPKYFCQLSDADIDYAVKIIEAAGLNYLVMPIVVFEINAKFTILGFIVDKYGRVTKCKIQKIESDAVDNMKTNDIPDTTLEERISRGFDDMEKTYAAKKANTLDDNDTFARIRAVIDIPYMQECTIVGIGCGGARSFYESMARMGVGNFILMDGDISSLSNIASQNGYISEVGLPKPVVIKRRLLDISRSINVTCHNRMLDDSLDDKWLEENIISHIDPKKALICAFTDNFFAQARISRIALKYKIPYISGAHHNMGDTSEMIFWYPGVTEYSQREITLNRYEAYRNGFKNTATSAGSPIFNTTRLNALCEKAAVGMLLFGKHPDSVWCSFLNKMFDRNLVIIRQKYLDPMQEGLNQLFDNGSNQFFDEVVWINPEEIQNLDSVSLEEYSDLSDTRKIFDSPAAKEGDNKK